MSRCRICDLPIPQDETICYYHWVRLGRATSEKDWTTKERVKTEVKEDACEVDR